MARWQGTALNRIVGLVGWGGTALVMLAVAVRFLWPGQQEIWNGLAIAGLVALLVYALTQWREIVQLFGGRQTKLGTMAAASVVIVLGILVGINYIASRQNKRWDVTAAQQFALSDQSRRILDSLDAPVKVTVFGREDDQAPFRQRLAEYEYQSSQISSQYIDLDKSPAVARQYEIQSYGTAVFEYEGRTERVTSSSEQDLTNTLIKVVEGAETKIYFLEGHGEKNPTSAERDGYNGITDALERENFAVETLVLAQQPDVPDDASVIILAGPTVDLLPSEADALRRYLDRGGKLLCLIDPLDTSDAPPLTTIAGLLGDYGIELGRDVVVDVSGVGQLIGTDAAVPVAVSYPSHPINEGFNLLTAYPLSRSVSVADGAESPRGQPFIETGARSWSETDIDALTGGQEVALDTADGDREGPITIGIALSRPATVTDAEDPAEGADDTEDLDDADDADDVSTAIDFGAEDDDTPPETRLVVIGDSDFASNFALGIQGNRDLFLNVVNWAAQQENLIAIRPREPEDRRITLTADQQQRIFWLSILFIPGLVIGSGVYRWWDQR